MDPDKDRAHHISDNSFTDYVDKLSLSNHPLSHSQFFNLNMKILWVRVLKEWSQQGRRRVFKSGAAEKAIECRRHERGRARDGDLFPSR